MDLMSNPKFREFIEHFHKVMQSVTSVSLEEARKQSTAFFSPPELPRESVDRIENVMIRGEEGNEIPLRIYSPRSSEPLPVFIYYHRGGWVFANIEEADPICRKLANHLECIVISVDYRLAPENPFPKPFNDCYDAFLWGAEHAVALGGNKDAVIIGGESAGGNLAAAVALRARDQKGPPIAIQLLIYPLISAILNDKAYEESADQYFLLKDAIHFFWTMYLQRPNDTNNCYASLDKASNLYGLPSTLLITAEHDPLHREGETYAQALLRAGNRVIVDRFLGVIHGFLDLPIYEDREIILWLQRIKEHLGHLLVAEELPNALKF